MTPGLLPGDIILVRSTGAVGALIRFGARVRYMGWARALWWLAKKAVGVAPPDSPDDPWYVSHAAVIVDQGQLIEALAGGLTAGRAGKYDGADIVTVRLADLLPDVTDVTRALVAAFAREQLARHSAYGWLSILSIVAQLVTPTRLDISIDGAVVCSAFAAQCLEHAGYTLATRSSLSTMPADLLAMAGSVADVALLRPILDDPQAERLEVPGDKSAA